MPALVSDAELLDLIRTTPWIARLLAEFDFDIARTVNGPPEPVHLESGEPLEMLAGDASGGAYLLVGMRPDAGSGWPVVYAGSEGEGGLIAASLRDALGLVVGLSSVHDAMAEPYGDDGGAVLRAWLAEADEATRADWPDLDADRQRLREALALPPADGMLEVLHRAAADERYRPISDEGDRYESMLTG